MRAVSGYTETYRGAEYKTRLLPKLKIEIAVNEQYVAPTIEAIMGAGRSDATGQIGDGKIFVLDLEDCVRIRTGEQGMVAIGPCNRPPATFLPSTRPKRPLAYRAARKTT